MFSFLLYYHPFCRLLILAFLSPFYLIYKYPPSLCLHILLFCLLFLITKLSRRPMRFGKRGSSTSTRVVDMPTTYQNFAADGGDPRLPSPAPTNVLPDRINSAHGLHLVGRPHFFLSKIFWRNRVGQNLPASQEMKVQPWRERKVYNDLLPFFLGRGRREEHVTSGSI